MFRKRTLILLALAVFLVTFCLYLSTLSHGFSDDESLSYAIALEKGGFQYPPNAFHLLWTPVGEFIKSAVAMLGLSVRGLEILEWTNAACGALTCAFLFFLLLSITADASLSFITALFVAFSRPFWDLCVSCKLYTLSGLLVVAFYFLLKICREGSRRAAWAVGLTHALAVLAHASNGPFMFVVLAGIFFPGRQRCLKDRIVLTFHYLASLGISLLLIVPLILSFHGTTISAMLNGISFLPAAAQMKSFTMLLANFLSVLLASGKMHFLPAFMATAGNTAGAAAQVESLLLSSVLLFVAFISIMYLLPWIRARLPWRLEYVLCLLWLLACFVPSFILSTDNIKICIVPLGVLCGLGFALIVSSNRVERAALLRRRIVLSVLAVMVLATFYLNATGVFLPASKGLTCPSYGPVSAYASVISQDDLVITSGPISLYFSYFLHCRVRDVCLNDFKDPEALLKEVALALKDGRKVYLHESPGLTGPHYILGDPPCTWNIGEAEYDNLDAKTRKAVQVYTSADLRRRLTSLADLVSVSKYSERDSLFLLKLRKIPDSSPEKKR
ncbi:MAG: hypothetical protein V2A78_07665 [bacterium]